MAEIAGGFAGSGSPPHFRRSLRQALSFPSFPALLLSALLLFTLRYSIFSLVFYGLSHAAKSDPIMAGLLYPGDVQFSAFPSPPPPRPGDVHFRTPFSSEPDPFFYSGKKSVQSNSSFLFALSPLKVVKIPVPSSSQTSPFFFTSPPDRETNSESETKPSMKEVLFLLFICFLCSLGYMITVVACVLVNCTALGVVFYSIVSIGYLKRNPLVPLQLFINGGLIGIKRLKALMILRWMLKDTSSQFIITTFIATSNDETELFKLMINSKLWPFSPVSFVTPFGSQNLTSLSLFLFALVDSLISVVFTMAPWVELMEIGDKRKDKDAIKEGCFLISLLPNRAIMIKLCEMVLCGSLGRSLMVKIGGRFYGGMVFAILEVYFMVVWFNFYISVRCKEAQMVGKKYELKELEEALNDLR